MPRTKKRGIYWKETGDSAYATKNQITAQHIKISKIFQWYEGDFTKNGSLIDFLNRYAPVKIDDDAVIEYAPYDWQLNHNN